MDCHQRQKEAKLEELTEEMKNLEMLVKKLTENCAEKQAKIEGRIRYTDELEIFLRTETVLATIEKKSSSMELKRLYDEFMDENLSKNRDCDLREWLKQVVGYVNTALYYAGKNGMIMGDIIKLHQVVNWNALMSSLLRKWKNVSNQLSRDLILAEIALNSSTVPPVLKEPLLVQIKSYENSREGWTVIHEKMCISCKSGDWQGVVTQKDELELMEKRCCIPYNNWKEIDCTELIKKHFEIAPRPDNNAEEIENYAVVEHDTPEIDRAPE